MLELVEPERLAGLTYLVDDAAMSGVGDRVPPGLPRLHGGVESVLSLQPDLVFVSPYSPAETVQLLLAAGMPVVRLQDVRRLADVLLNLRIVGAATGEMERARELEAELRTRLRAVARLQCRDPRPRVLLLGYGYGYGAGTLQDAWLRRARVCNVVAEAGLKGTVPLPSESWLELDPEWILVETAGRSLEPGRADLLGQGPLVDELRKRLGRRVIGVPRSWSGAVSHQLVRAIEEVSALLCRPRP